VGPHTSAGTVRVWETPYSLRTKFAAVYANGDRPAVETRDIDGDFHTHLTVPMRVYVCRHNVILYYYYGRPKTAQSSFSFRAIVFRAYDIHLCTLPPPPCSFVGAHRMPLIANNVTWYSRHAVQSSTCSWQRAADISRRNRSDINVRTPCVYAVIGTRKPRESWDPETVLGSGDDGIS
jgi:hypothetical protein